jgi:uncharacterized protein (DUF1501 family)
MLNRREFLSRALQGSSLVALSPLVPGFVANTARAAEAGKDKILVLLEMNGGNDGLNTVAPYGDDLYQKARPTLGLKKTEVLRIDDYLGLNTGLRGLHDLLNKGQLAVVQGVGYPNPDRSHFESMDIWQSADPRRQTGNGWIGRSLDLVKVAEGRIPGICVGKEQLPLALQGSATGVPAIQTGKPYDLDLLAGPGAPPPSQRGPRKKPAGPAAPTGKKADAKDEERRAERLRLIQDVADLSPPSAGDLPSFVRRSSLQTYTSLERLRKLLQEDGTQGGGVPNPGRFNGQRTQLTKDLTLVARIIRAGFGTRVFYVAIDGFDTHARQRQQHQELLQELGGAIASFFQQLETSGDAKRVVLMTFSEFGRRVHENGSKGTDHGAASCLFVAGPAVKAGPFGKHPSLAKDALDAGDLKYHTDFRQVYATLLDRWLECDSARVLAGKFEHLTLLK